jgi:hypothetical protein
MAVKELRSRMLRLLREDEEFRYAVAGLLGLGEILKRLDRHEAELVRLREDMNKLREDMNKLREDMVEGFRRHDIELARLRGDMIRGFELVERHITALGARWGIMAESAFRESLESLKGLLEKELGYRVEKWTVFDEAGRVYGYPSVVDVDVTVSDGKLILVEVSSHIKASDITTFRRKAELYMEKAGKRPDKLVVVTPYIDDRAAQAAKELGIEVYTKV